MIWPEQTCDEKVLNVSESNQRSIISSIRLLIVPFERINRGEKLREILRHGHCYIPPIMFGLISQNWHNPVGLLKYSSRMLVTIKLNSSGAGDGLVQMNNMHIVTLDTQDTDITATKVFGLKSFLFQMTFVLILKLKEGIIIQNERRMQKVIDKLPDLKIIFVRINWKRRAGRRQAFVQTGPELFLY